MTGRINIILLISLCSLIATAQDKTTDSLKKLAATMPDDSAKAEVLLQISRSYFNISSEDAITYAADAKTLSEKIGYNKGVALAWKNIGIAHYFKGTHLEAIDAWQQSLMMYEKMQDKRRHSQHPRQPWGHLRKK